jgi:hypothetical protein
MEWLKLGVQFIALAGLIFCVIAVGNTGHWGLAGAIMLCGLVISL